MNKVTMAAAICALAFSSAATAQVELSEDQFRELVAENSYPISRVSGELSGPGYDFLIESGTDAQFFLLGEQHGTADIAIFSEDIYRGLAAVGYDTAVVEIGPFSTETLEDLLRDDDPLALEKLILEDDNLLTFPFVFYAEEVDFLREVIASSPDQTALWGVDQEFIGGSRLVAEMVADEAVTLNQREAAAAFQAAAAEDIMHVGIADETYWAELEAAFAGTEGTRGHMLVQELIRTNRIYAPFTNRPGSGYWANFERENLMKTNFLAAFNAATEIGGPAPRVFAKMGANHTSYGRSPTDVFAFGNFLNEWGLADGFETFNVHVDCRGGSSLDPRTEEAVPCETYFLANGGILADIVANSPTAVIDLRPLRRFARHWEFIDEETHRLIMSYDAYVALPDVAAASLVSMPED